MTKLKCCSKKIKCITDDCMIKMMMIIIIMVKAKEIVNYNDDVLLSLLISLEIFSLPKISKEIIQIPINNFSYFCSSILIGHN